MPQIYIKLSRTAASLIEHHERTLKPFFEKIDKEVTPLVVSMWSVPEDDVACSGVRLDYTRNEADVQIEIRYTTGLSTYTEGVVFEPTIAQQSELNDAIANAVAPTLAEYHMSCSVWCKPHQESKFTMVSAGLNQTP